MSTSSLFLSTSQKSAPQKGKPSKTLDFTITKIFKAKDASDDCVIEGYANTSSKDRVGDVVMPKAFEKSLPTYLKNPVLLANHNWEDVVGRTLEARTDDKGLYIKARISDTRPDVKTLIREGCLSTFSIGYNELDADYDESTKTKYIKDLELLEISVVSVPANTEASFTLAQTKVNPDQTGDSAPDMEKPKEEPSDSNRPRLEASDEEPKRAPKTEFTVGKYVQLVKGIFGATALSDDQIVAVCDFYQSNEELMTKEELIAALRKSVPAKAEAKADGAPDAPMSEQKPDGQGNEAEQQILAKLNALAEGMAQLLERIGKLEQEEQDEHAEEAQEGDDGKTGGQQDAPKDKPEGEQSEDMSQKPKGEDEKCPTCGGDVKKPKDPKDSNHPSGNPDMTDEEMEKQMADLDAAISELDEKVNG